MASVWGRFVSAVQAGIAAFNERAIIPNEADMLSHRQFRYLLWEAFYNNNAYRTINNWSHVFKQNQELYKHIRGIYNPVYRAVELNTSKIAGGSIDWDDLQKGALQVTQADDTLLAALIQVLRWSNWGVNKSLYVRQAAMKGDVGLWVVDDRQRQKVRLEVLQPYKIKAATRDDAGNVKSATLEYGREWHNPDTNKTEIAVFRMEADKERFATFKDDEPFGWFTDQSGNGVAEWENEYGFVPLLIAKFKDIGQGWGVNVCHAALPKINELNDAASILNDNVRKTLNAPWYFPNSKASDVTVSGNLADGTAGSSDPSARRDKVSTLHGPADSTPTALVMPIPISEAVQNIAEIMQDIERDIPELALQRVRESAGNTSAIAVRNMFSDATGRLDEAAGNLDDALIRGLQMCVSIGGLRNYNDMQSFSPDSFDRGDLEFYIKERAFFEDSLTAHDKIVTLQALPADQPETARLILEEMEYQPDQIERVVNGLSSSNQQQQTPFADNNPFDDDAVSELGNIFGEIEGGQVNGNAIDGTTPALPAAG